MKKSQFFSLMKLRRLSVASVAGMGAGGGGGRPGGSCCWGKVLSGGWGGGGGGGGGGGASQAVLLFVEECDWKVIGISRKYFA